MLSHVSKVKVPFQVSQSEDVSVGVRKANEKHDHPGLGRVQGLAASFSGHAGARSPEASSDLSSAPASSPGHGASGP